MPLSLWPCPGLCKVATNTKINSTYNYIKCTNCYNRYINIINFSSSKLDLNSDLPQTVGKISGVQYIGNGAVHRTLPVHGLACFCTVPGVTANVNVVSCMAVSVAESPPTAPSPTVPSRPTHSVSLMSQDDARFTRHGLLFGWLEKLSTYNNMWQFQQWYVALQPDTRHSQTSDYTPVSQHR